MFQILRECQPVWSRCFIKQCTLLVNRNKIKIVYYDLYFILTNELLIIFHQIFQVQIEMVGTLPTICFRSPFAATYRCHTVEQTVLENLCHNKHVLAVFLQNIGFMRFYIGFLTNNYPLNSLQFSIRNYAIINVGQTTIAYITESYLYTGSKSGYLDHTILFFVNLHGTLAAR